MVVQHHHQMIQSLKSGPTQLTIVPEPNDSLASPHSKQKFDKEQFISEIYFMEPIWKWTHRLHKDFSHINGLYEMVGKWMKMSREDVKKCWRNLYDQFRCHLKIERTRPTGSARKPYAGARWPYYMQMLFTAPYIENRGTQTNWEHEQQPDNGESSVMNSLDVSRQEASEIDFSPN